MQFSWRDFPLAELTPTALVAIYRERDVRDTKIGRRNLARIRESFKRDDDLRTPLQLFFDPATGCALLLDGNHRIEVALEKQMPEVPLQVFIHPLDGRGYPVPRAHLAAKTDESGPHYPYEVHPSAIFDAALLAQYAGIPDRPRRRWPHLFG